GRVVMRDRGAGLRFGQAQQHEFSVALDGINAASGQMLFERGRIVDEISLAEPDCENAATENSLAQAARYGFDFGEFGHGGAKPQYSARLFRGRIATIRQTPRA